MNTEAVKSMRRSSNGMSSCFSSEQRIMKEKPGNATRVSTSVRRSHFKMVVKASAPVSSSTVKTTAGVLAAIDMSMKLDQKSHQRSHKDEWGLEEKLQLKMQGQCIASSSLWQSPTIQLHWRESPRGQSCSITRTSTKFPLVGYLQRSSRTGSICHVLVGDGTE